MYAEVAAKYETDWNNFTAKVNTAVSDYEAGVARVEELYDSILANAYSDAELYWSMHYDMPDNMVHLRSRRHDHNDHHAHSGSTSRSTSSATVSHSETTTTTTTTVTWTFNGSSSTTFGWH